MPPRVSIIILNWNGLENTVKCLESLKKITYLNCEVILVDNGSKEGDTDFLDKKYKNYIKLIKNKENLGFTGGNNIAIREIMKEGKSGYILLLNNDITVEPNFLDELVECALRHQKSGSIQPKMIFTSYPKIIDSTGIVYSKNSLAFNRGVYEPIENYTEEKEIFGCCAGACLYKIDALRDIKINNEYFDNDFFAFYEDVDLSFRLQWAGWKSWYCPKAIVYHKRGATTGARSNFTIYHSSKNQTLVFFKNFPNSFILKNFPLFFITEIFQIVLDLIKGKQIILKAKFDAYKNLKNVLKKKKLIKKIINFEEIEKWLILKWKVNTPFYSYFKKKIKP
jgi:GT2 family glycosyltransferase